MPEGSKVHKVYEALREKGYSKEKSAKIAQAQTGESLKTGEPIKNESYENGKMRAMNEIDQKLENSGIKRDKQGRFSSNGSSEKETDWDELKSKSTEKKISGEKESDKSEFPDKNKKVGWYVKGEYKK